VKELSKVETKLPAMTAGDNQEVISGDVLVPKLLLQQGLSEFVSNRKAQIGDIIKNTTVEKLDDPDRPVEIIPLAIKNSWVMQENVAGKYEYRGVEDRNASNSDLPWEFKQNGADWRRIKSLDVYVLLPSDIDAELNEIEKFKKDGSLPDLNKTLLPAVISFRNTSFKAGRFVSTHFMQAKAMAKFNVQPYHYTLMLSCHQEDNSKGTFYVFDISKGNPTKKEHVVKAEEWSNVLKHVNVKVDESGEAPLPSGSREVDI
jgi:hypothetical protein